MRTEALGSSDVRVLEWAEKEQRTIITFDKNFGELAFRLGLPATCGIIPFRALRGSPAEFAEFAVMILESRSDWNGNFAVVESSRIRMRPLARC